MIHVYMCSYVNTHNALYITLQVSLDSCLITSKNLDDVEIKGQMDATERVLLQNFLSAQHVSGTIMPIIRSSRVI